jgi:hypothetical protein
VARIRQRLAGDHIEDVEQATCEKVLASPHLAAIKEGHRIAITAGSRGMGEFTNVLRGVVNALKQKGARPFLIPAMGSHGGAVAEQQIEVLARCGVTEESVGAPIRATMDTIDLGRASNGAQAHLDKYADEADGIIALGRVAIHPESDHDLASGLLKVCTIGLGKQAGAQSAHSHGLWDSVRAVPHLHFKTGKIRFGLAVVENGYRHPAHIEVVAPTYDAFLEADQRLLKLVKEKYFARLPFDQLDVLVVDRVGKNISGAGMDPNVIGKWRATGKGPHQPDYRRIVALSLTRESLGNGMGAGMADFITRRFKETYDPDATYVNLLTATEPDSSTREAPLPLALDTDQEAIEVALYSALADGDARLCRIKSTEELDEFWVSPALLDECQRHPNLDVMEQPSPLPFNAEGNLL